MSKVMYACADPEGYNGGKQDTRGSNSIQVRNISLADAHHLEATVGPRTVRAKHLPPALQRRYGMGVAALQPSEVHSVRRVFEDVPARYAAPDVVFQVMCCCSQLVQMLESVYLVCTCVLGF